MKLIIFRYLNSGSLVLPQLFIQGLNWEMGFPYFYLIKEPSIVKDFNPLFCYMEHCCLYSRLFFSDLYLAFLSNQISPLFSQCLETYKLD